ncbi:MAG: hypothetical protein CK538_05195 [Opitutia bacterium]|nr:MAG: hypothetical protein CK538_05195 [Opitutae bacterium]
MSVPLRRGPDRGRAFLSGVDEAAVGLAAFDVDLHEAGGGAPGTNGSRERARRRSGRDAGDD